MPKILVNLDGGLNTQDDEKSVGFTGFTKLQNVRFAGSKIMKRYGTGTQSAALTSVDNSYKINDAAIFVNRRFTGARVNDTNDNNITFNSSAKTMTIASTTGLVIPGGSTDLTTIFKAGDTITIEIDETSSNKDKSLVIASVAALEVTFTTAVADETLNGSNRCIISFVADVLSNGTTPDYLAIGDTNSIDGRAIITTFIDGTTMDIGMINANNYGNPSTIKSIADASDMHIRTKAYSDAVRFACGLEHSPLVYRYINRHHFNGLYKEKYNSNAHTLYPTWYLDTAVPVVTANTFSDTELSAASKLRTFATNVFVNVRNVGMIDGALNLVDNEYTYKFIPVYDGGQEGILDDAVIEVDTAGKLVKNREKSGILTAERSCVHINSTIDVSKLNPRMSGLNVYRSTNGGTYFKIKSIYMGDDDPTQKSAEARTAHDIFWYKGGTTQTGNSNGAHTTLDDAVITVDGFKFATVDGSGYSDFEGTGYQAVEIDSGLAAFRTGVADTLSSGTQNSYNYGAQSLSVWNKKSEATATIYANNGEAIGGSANGGWFIGKSAEKNYIDGSENGGLDWSDISDSYSVFGQRFNDSSKSADGGYQAMFTTTGTTADDADGIGNLIITKDGNNLNDGTTYIVAGWIRADGFDHPEASWRCFLGATDNIGSPDAVGELLIAEGSGGDINQNIDKWRYFQYEYVPSTVESYLYVYINNANQTGVAAKARVQIQGLTIREPFDTSHEFADGLVGFAGPNVLVGSAIDDLGVPSGTLKGNRIQNDDEGYARNETYDYSWIADNVGPFIKTVSTAPTDNASDANGNDDDSNGGSGVASTYLLSTSNYQFVSNGVNTGTTVKLDFFDPGLPDGARHPYEASKSLDVKYKYATMLNGRQFVGNVKIKSDGESEEYPNFIMFSAANSPDVIPVANFIQLQDLQGGEIVGIDTLMSDIVVFMENGIFRLNTPSVDPSAWSLVEAHPNIGCLHDKTITKVPNGIYFLSKDDVIFLDSSFQATPISNEIRDDYQAIAASTPSIMRTHYDIKNNKLYVTKLVSTNTEFWVYDTRFQKWSTELHAGVEYDEFLTDNENNVLLIESGANGSGGAGNNSYISKAVDTTEYRDDNGSGARVAIDMIVETGVQELTSYDQNAYVRRLNTHTNKGGGTKLDQMITIDGTANTKADHLDGAQSQRLTVKRGKNIKVKINDATNEDNAKEITKVEVEYE